MKRAKVSLLVPNESGSISPALMNERYELLEPLAQGGRGTVFLGRDRQTGEAVAIKRIRKDKTADFEESAKALFHEAEVQAKVRHPNVAAVYNVGTDEQGGYLVMELAQGETLDELVMRQPLGREDFDALVRETLSGVGAVHTAGLLHLDLKPGNLVIWRTREARLGVKIIDFGLARPAGEAGGVNGSVHFMAPELFENAAADERTDLYSLGCIFYHALTQWHPFEGEMAPQVIVSHLYHLHKSLAELRPDLPQVLVAWVERLMSRAQVDRPASAEEALRAYEQACR